MTRDLEREIERLKQELIDEGQQIEQLEAELEKSFLWHNLNLILGFIIGFAVGFYVHSCAHNKKQHSRENKSQTGIVEYKSQNLIRYQIKDKTGGIIIFNYDLLK